MAVTTKASATLRMVSARVTKDGQDKRATPRHALTTAMRTGRVWTASAPATTTTEAWTAASRSAQRTATRMACARTAYASASRDSRAQTALSSRAPTDVQDMVPAMLGNASAIPRGRATSAMWPSAPPTARHLTMGRA